MICSMSRYPINPRTGRREPPPGAEVGQRVFEAIAAVVLAFVALTLVAGVLYGCVMLWQLMLT